MSDLIDRNAALACFHDWIDKYGDEHTADEMPEYRAIEALPTAEPEYRLDEWCTGCKEYDQDRHCCPRYNRVIRNTVNEFHTRRKTGKWIDVGSLSCRCSECGCKSAKETSYCPNCGTKMRD